MSRALGRYELLRPIARGGMAEVYLARRRAAGVEKVLVVKRMRRERAGDARFLDLFQREAKLSMSLVHQNIVPVFDFGRIDDQVFLAMERVEGRDLGTALGKAGRAQPLPNVLAAFVAAECCQALDYAHRRRGPDGAELGIVHRDVTPRNVLLSWSGEVKLTDFGIASLAGDDPTRVIGTPAYMAPEQARGETVDPRADIYAVGLILREALVGERARRGDDRDATLAAARANTLPAWPDGFESPLRAIAERATATDPGERYADARAMLEELDGFIVGERAANKDERRAPARQLAAWLGSLYTDESDEISGDQGIDAGNLVSFIDDGSLGVVGTGTERSMAATAGDDDEAAAGEAKPAASHTPKPSTVSSPGQAVAEPAKRKPRFAAIGLGVAAAGALAVVLVVTMSSSTAERPPQAPVDPPKAHVPPQPPPPQPPPPQKLADVPPQPPPPQKLPPKPPRPPVASNQLGSAAPPKPPQPPVPMVAIAKHRITVNTKPWSNFTVDGGGDAHETPSAVELAPGVHRFHFTNPQLHLERDATFEVKDADAAFFTDLQK